MIRDPGPADLKAIRALFIKMLGEELQLVYTTGEKFDIRDRIALLTLCDRVLAREKSDDDAERAGSKVKQYATSFQAPARVGAGNHGAGLPSGEHDADRDDAGSGPGSEPDEADDSAESDADAA